MTIPAQTQLTEDDIRRICQFLGYGNPCADVWFLGIEEGGGDVEQLHKRAKWQQVMDCKTAHQDLGIEEFHQGKNSKLQRTWNGMCRLMLEWTPGSNSDHCNRRCYQSEMLGRSNGETFLTELYPLPKPRANIWPRGYTAALGGRFPSPNDYRRQQRPSRIALLGHAIKKYRPRLIIAYGKGYWNEYRQLAPGVNWKSHGLFEMGTMGQTTFVLIPHFVARQMNGQVPVLYEIIAPILK